MEEFGNSLLVLGGARSGKSRYAQAMAERGVGSLVFVATAQAFDQEMIARIARHRGDRDGRWRTIEVPIELAEAVSREDRADTIFVIDCLTLWVSNLLLAEVDIFRSGSDLCAVISRLRGRVILVSNEVGSGIVPANALARRFRDAAGEINQMVAAACVSVELVVAGLPLRLKGPEHGETACSTRLSSGRAGSGTIASAPSIQPEG